MNVHHIGIITKNMENSIDVYERLGYQKQSDIFYDNIQNNRIVFMKNISDEHVIELIEPFSNLSSVYNFPEGYHHICYVVDDYDNFLMAFKKMKIGKIFTQPIQAPAIGEKKVVFAYLKTGMFVEFLIQKF